MGPRSSFIYSLHRQNLYDHGRSALNMALVSGSVTDIVTTAGTVKKLVATLREAQTAPSEYQAVIRELNNLDTVLGDLRDLAQLCDRIGSYESLAQRARLEALKCRALIDPYRDKIAQYRGSLREGGSGNPSRDQYWKLHWRSSHQDDLEEFRRAISSQLQVMTVIIATAKM